MWAAKQLESALLQPVFIRNTSQHINAQWDDRLSSATYPCFGLDDPLPASLPLSLSHTTQFELDGHMRGSLVTKFLI